MSISPVSQGYLAGLAVGGFIAAVTVGYLRVPAVHASTSVQAEVGVYDRSKAYFYTDAIVSGFQKQGMPVYAVGPDGPPPLGKPVTAEMFTVICVEEK